MTRRAAPALALAVMCLLAACGGNKGIKQSGPTVAGGRAGDLAVQARAQTTGGKNVLVDQATLTGSRGFVAIQSDDGGRPGAVLGVSRLLTPGTTRKVKIKLRKPLSGTVTVFAGLYLDDNHNGAFDSSGDQPAQVGSSPVDARITVTVR